MAERKKFLLRLDPDVFAAVQRWAGDDFRSANAQIEYLLNDALRRVGRLRSGSVRPMDESPDTPCE